MQTIWTNVLSFIHKYFSISSISVIDVIEMLIIAFLFYKLIVWMKNSRAWTLLRGILFIALVVILANIFQMSTLTWLTKNLLSVGILAVIIIFQPEFRKALDRIGKNRTFARLFKSGKNGGILSSGAVREICAAVGIMSKERTGALICIERNNALNEYTETGIKIDSVITRQLILNIFEDKTPLHDGAVIIHDNRITAATCYLPMSENSGISKRYGTRHRAAVGLSEITDAYIIIVSEETGGISVAISGRLYSVKDEEELKTRLNGLAEVKETEAGHE